MKEHCGYAGKIKNTGTQYVEAPGQVKSGSSGGKVISGKDLRTGKK